ncbi:hypothetical protein ACFXKC_56830 [Streptomyces sp. NPDC059340]|uniref:hypothetical protein n=1 Tax=Streptomyces sp. NPDC059340 TaxID=3346806 RepID=UPI0036AD355C
MLPIGSLENLLSAIGEQTTRSLLAITPYGGADHARRNAAAAAAASAERHERDAVSACWPNVTSPERSIPDRRGQACATHARP